MKLMIFAIFVHIVFSEVGCLVKLRYTNNECTQVTEEYEVRALGETCLQESGGDAFFKGRCQINDGVPDTSSIRSWEECEDNTCNDGLFDRKCKNTGAVRSPEEFECRYSKITVGVGGNDVWEQYVCMTCNEVPCYAKFVDGTNPNPECSTDCSLPSSQTGYIIGAQATLSSCTYEPNGCSAPAISGVLCDSNSGYSGNAVVSSACSEGNMIISLSGCSPIQCTTPTDTAGYNIPNSWTCTAISCDANQLSCASGFEGRPSVSCTSGDFILAGCTAITVTEDPTPTTSVSAASTTTTSVSAASTTTTSVSAASTTTTSVSAASTTTTSVSTSTNATNTTSVSTNTTKEDSDDDSATMYIYIGAGVAACCCITALVGCYARASSSPKSRERAWTPTTIGVSESEDKRYPQTFGVTYSDNDFNKTGGIAFDL